MLHDNDSGPPLNGDCSVLIPSCDSYADLWIPFFRQFFLNWNDCPLPIFLGSDHRIFNDARVTTVAANAGRAWSDAVRVHLSAIQTPFVLIMLDDFFLRSPVSTHEVLERLNDLKRLNGHCMRLIPDPKPNRHVANSEHIGEIGPGAAYRVSTQGAIWRKETLLSLLGAGESIWEFEQKGSKRSDNLQSGFFGTWKHVLTYRHHVVQRGKWFPQEALRFRVNGAGIDLGARPIMSLGETGSWLADKLIASALDPLPHGLRLRLVNKLRKVQSALKRVVS